MVNATVLLEHPTPTSRGSAGGTSHGTRGDIPEDYGGVNYSIRGQHTRRNHNKMTSTLSRSTSDRAQHIPIIIAIRSVHKLSQLLLIICDFSHEHDIHRDIILFQLFAQLLQHLDLILHRRTHEDDDALAAHFILSVLEGQLSDLNR